MNNKLWGLSTIIAIALASCSNDSEPQPQPESTPAIERRDIQLSRAESEIVTAQNEFAFELFSRMSNGKTTDNIYVSPFSVSSTLSMLANGADGNELKDLTSALGVTDINQLNSLYCRLFSELTAVDNSVTFKSSNSLWGAPGFTFYDDFAGQVMKFYGAETFTADFSQQSGVDAFNAWCSRETDGIIEKVMDKTNSDLQLVLANATLFKGAWTYEFEKDKTAKGEFHSAAGVQTVDMMCHEYGYKTGFADGISMARLTYGNGAFRVTFLLPSRNSDLSTMISSLNLYQWEELKSAYFYEGHYSIYLPKFKGEYKNGDFIDILKEWMPAAFGDNNRYLKLGYCDDGNLMKVSKVTHDVSVEFDEKGTAAAAITTIEILEGSSGAVYDPNFRLDRPFVFVIDEVSTGAVLFIGAVNSI